jgi:predicted DNA-binding protein (MmcQ/YjbR family)/antitoxin component YwqK of YwqJK toxin-antitoxin module
MNVEEIRGYCLGKEAVDEGFPFGEGVLVFKANGKIFLLMSLDEEPLQFNVKCDPERAQELREQYDCIVPGYHMNKKHWNTVIVDNTLNKKQLKELIDHSYELVYKPKKEKSMIRNLLLLLLLSISSHSFAQSLIPFEFTSEDENRLVKENDSFKYYVASDDTMNTVALNEEALYYKLMNKDLKVIATGNYSVEGERYLQEGAWVEKYDNGKLKLMGSYYKNRPIGTWQEYYSSGKLKVVCNYSIFSQNGELSYCLCGNYQEYYPTGILKASGLYIASAVSRKDTMTVTDPITRQDITNVVSHKSVQAAKAGHWEYYDEHGELDRKEDL